jgi:hypothetical protein
MGLTFETFFEKKRLDNKVGRNYYLFVWIIRMKKEES